MSNRCRLPNRRLAETFDFEHEGLKYTATIGRDADGKVAEIFLNARPLLMTRSGMDWARWNVSIVRLAVEVCRHLNARPC